MYHPPFELAGTLVHESDHRKYHEENGALFWNEEKLKEFAGTHNKEIELRAYQNELVFLNRARGLIDPGWEVEIVSGKLLLTYELDEIISNRQKTLEGISKLDSGATEYKHVRQDASYTDQIALMTKLGIKLDASKLGATYRRREIQF
jgi:hypothetical protein